jgi:hypothetical protein
MKAMSRHLSTWIGLAAAAWFVAAPVTAQDRATATPSGGGGGATASAGGGGGGSVSSGGGGGDRASAGGGGSFSGGGGGSATHRADAGGFGGATGGSGVAMPRGEYARSGGSVSRSSSGASGRNDSGARAARGEDGERTGVPQHSRPRDGATRTGTAVERPAGSIPSPGGGIGGSNSIFVPGGYYGGYSYYPGMYGGYYGGYYDPFYDPWYGGFYSSYSYPQSSGYAYGTDDGSLRLKIKPRDGQVYVDGYYVGTVDEFDGMFQKLHIESGAHRIEVRADGFEPLVFEVRITPEHKTTYQGEMKRVQ